MHLAQFAPLTGVNAHKAPLNDGYPTLAEVLEDGRSMKHLLVIFVVALLALVGPATTQPWADDAHHPEKAAKAKKPGKARPKQPQKKPAVKTDTSKQSGLPSPRV